MQYLLASLALLIAGCATSPATQSPLSKAQAELMAQGATTTALPGHYAESYGASMGEFPPNAWLLFVEDYASVQAGQVCGYQWGNRPILHRVRGKIGADAWIMQGDMNPQPDPGVMTSGNYLGTYVGYVLWSN